MIKQCVVLNGAVINIGEWDYQYVEIGGEQVAQNPFPEGAVIEEREFEYSEEHGWREVGYVPEPTPDQRINELEKLLVEISLEV